VIPYLQKDFGLEPRIAADTLRILKQIVNAEGDIEEPVLQSIIERIRQEPGYNLDVPLDRLVDLSFLRDVRKELRRK
jgi:hypothetical protein